VASFSAFFVFICAKFPYFNCVNLCVSVANYSEFFLSSSAFIRGELPGKSASVRLMDQKEKALTPVSSDTGFFRRS
jgi:hypothetical protein